MLDNEGNPLKAKKHHERQQSVDVNINNDREKKNTKNIGQFILGKKIDAIYEFK